MMKVNLTENLNKHKAIVLQDWQDCPDGYFPVSGVLIRGHDIQIAIPQKLMNDRKLFNMLANEAQKCLMKLR